MTVISSMPWIKKKTIAADDEQDIKELVHALGLGARLRRKDFGDECSEPVDAPAHSRFK